MNWRYFVSWLFWVNFLFFQWFFVRLQETGSMVDEKFVHESWGWRRWVVPVTGWWTDYRYWPRHVR